MMASVLLPFRGPQNPLRLSMPLGQRMLWGLLLSE
jgi:hypothetical protein